MNTPGLLWRAYLGTFINDEPAVLQAERTLKILQNKLHYVTQIKLWTLIKIEPVTPGKRS